MRAVQRREPRAPPAALPRCVCTVGSRPRSRGIGRPVELTQRRGTRGGRPERAREGGPAGSGSLPSAGLSPSTPRALPLLERARRSVRRSACARGPVQSPREAAGRQLLGSSAARTGPPGTGGTLPGGRMAGPTATRLQLRLSQWRVTVLVGLRRIYLLDRAAVLPNALRDPHTALPPRSQVQTARSATHLVTLRSCPV